MTLVKGLFISAVLLLSNELGAEAKFRQRNPLGKQSASSVRALQTGVPETWTCLPEYFADGQFCDCDCGAFDTDCFNSDFDSSCPTGQLCSAEGVCEGPLVVPDTWTCDPADYAAGNECDCGCGAFDPDCVYNNPIKGCPNGEQHCSYENECINVPVEWQCNTYYFNVSDGCDCKCGIVDPDCFLPDQTLYNCKLFEQCDASGECIEAAPTQQPTPDGLPESWSCLNVFYNAKDGCDCNCGAYDPDCGISGSTIFNCEDDVLGCSNAGACIYKDASPNPTFSPTITVTSYPTGAELSAFEDPVVVLSVAALVAIVAGGVAGCAVCASFGR